MYQDFLSQNVAMDSGIITTMKLKTINIEKIEHDLQEQDILNASDKVDK